MQKPIRVLKSDQVLVRGSVCLDTASGIAPVRSETPCPTDAHASTSPGHHAQEAKIVESNSEYAIIEIICGCGSKTHVQCNYGDIATPQPAEPEQPVAAE